MKKTFEQRIKSSLLSIGKKNGFFRLLVIPALFAVVFYFHLSSFVKNNSKRLALSGMTFFLFAAYSSFSFPIFTHEEVKAEEAGNDYILSLGEEAVALAQETEVNPEELEILDDDDVIGDFNELEHQNLDNVDKFELDEILDANEALQSLRDKNKQSGAGNAEPETFSKDDWRLVLINKQHPIPEDYTFTLGNIKGNMKCDDRIIDDLLSMLQEAKDDGVSLVICSPYRDMERQETLFNTKIKRYMQKGMSYMDAYKLAGQAVTVPGASEHQIGLALDIVCSSYMSLDEGYGDTEAGKWLAENCADFGFILRYPKGKEYITGIEYEPWHFRYVGTEAAQAISEAGMTLEEFWEDL